MADKRKTGRRIKRLHATLFCDGEERMAISSNFSLSGLFLKTRKKFKPGSPVNVTLHAGDDQQISLQGKIAWVKSSGKKSSVYDKFNEGIGITLTETPEEYKEFLKVIIREHL